MKVFAASERTKPRIGVFIGDPGGIGPEVAIKAIHAPGARDMCTPVIFGAVHVLERVRKVLGVDLAFTQVENLADVESLHGLAVHDASLLKEGDYHIGRASRASGEASWAWYHAAKDHAESGALDGWAAGPINSDSILATGRVDDINDMLPANSFSLRINGGLRIVPLSEHIPLRRVSDDVTPDKVFHVVDLLDGNLRRWGLVEPRIAIAGINPHASFTEDAEKIAPAVLRLRGNGVNVVGPIAPDSVFRHALEGKYDAIVTMYHDQGQIVLKTVAFEGACSVFMGLSHIMIGMPHGSAYDIAGQGRA